MRVRKHLVLIFFSALLLGCSERDSSHQEPPEEAESAGPLDVLHLSGERLSMAGLKIEQVRVRSLTGSIAVPGRIDFNQRRVAHLTSRVAGRVEEVDAFLGDRVEENALLATIYSQEYLTAQAEIIQAEERMKYAEARNDSAELTTAQAINESARRKLFVMGATEKDLDEIADTNIPKTLLEIRAPFSGTVTQADEILGHVVEVGTNLFHIADILTLWVIVDIYEKDLAKVKAGLDATVEVAAYPGEKFEGHLTTVFDVLDEKTRTVKARVEVHNPERKLKPQMFATVTLHTENVSDVVAAPSKAVQAEAEDLYVFVAVDDTSFLKRSVQPGREFDGWIEIVDGLSPGESVVTDGAFILKSESAKATFGEE
jgi:RND family efflux transporter MFP subunit